MISLNAGTEVIFSSRASERGLGESRTTEEWLVVNSFQCKGINTLWNRRRMA